MLGVALAVFFDGLEKVPQAQIVTALAPIHASETRLDVSQRDVVVGLLENRMRLTEQFQRIPGTTLLEQKPALRHSHRGGHRLHTCLARVPVAFRGVRQRMVILAGFAIAAAAPEMRQSQHHRIGDLRP